MSSALGSPQSSNSNEALPKFKFRIRWRLMLIGLGLLAFGLALPLVLNLYYSSSYSQISDSKQISGSRLDKKNSLKLNFRKKPKVAAEESSEPDDFEKTSYEVSANPADIIPASAFDSNYPETSKTSTALTSGLPNSAQIQLKIALSANVVRTQCPSGSRPFRMNCGNTRVIVTAEGGRPPYRYTASGGRVAGQGQSRTVWDLSDVQPGTYSITVVSGNASAKADVRVENCKCIDVTPPKTPTPTPGIIPTPTIPPTPIPSATPIQDPTPTPTSSPVITPTRTATNSTPVNTTGNTLTPSPTNTIPVNAVTPANGTPTNTATVNTNVNGSNSGDDKIGYVYPARFIKDTEYTICLSLQPEQSSVKLCEQTSGSNNSNSIIGSATVPSITKSGYEAFVTAQLTTGDGLEIVGKPRQMRLPYDRQSGNFPIWKWKLKLSGAGENAGTVEIKFNCDVEWVSKENSDIVEKQGKYWTSDALKSSVGLPLTSKIFTYLSTITGGLAFIFSVVPVWGGKKEDIAVPMSGGIKENTEKIRTQTIETRGVETQAKDDETEASKKEDILKETPLPPGGILNEDVLEDEVHCTLYAPPKARAGTSFVIQIFAHLFEQADELEAMAQALDEEAKKHVAEKLKRKIKRGSTLNFKLTMPGLEADETEESAAWEGEPVEIQFIVSVPDNHASGNRFGKVSVYENNEKIGNITFRIEILAREEQQPSAQPSDAALALAHMSRKESAFVSYASEDKAEVYDRLRLLDSIGVEYHVDIINIAPGDRWEQKLYEFIDADDVFLLFWSKAASHSEWVLKEAERAHLKTGSERKNPPKIVIYHLETPPAVELPEWLRDIHYDRKWTQLSENARRQD